MIICFKKKPSIVKTVEGDAETEGFDLTSVALAKEVFILNACF
jgi:hypothetical protein